MINITQILKESDFKVIDYQKKATGESFNKKYYCFKAK